jgi:hypothetical protein
MTPWPSILWHCRACHATFAQGETRPSELPDFRLHPGGWNSHELVGKTIGHQCSGKMMGVADFAGVQFEEGES